jgi:hypothetical protein
VQGFGKMGLPGFYELRSIIMKTKGKYFWKEGRYMTITELINKLTEILNEKGDLPIYTRQWGDNSTDLLEENEITTPQAEILYLYQGDYGPNKKFDLPDRVELN